VRTFSHDYYEQPGIWDKDYMQLPREKERILEVIKNIPFDVETILDAGCGNGAFLNTIADTCSEKYKRLAGTDVSAEALKYVKTEKYRATIAHLPFHDKSFDLVTCLEVAEHLPQHEYENSLREVQRVGRKYILLTVPNSDDLRHFLAMCPKCYCWFNSLFHVRSFNKESLRTLLNTFEPVEIKEIGPIVKRRHGNALLFDLYQAWRKPKPSVNSICPQCGQMFNKQEAGNDDKATKWTVRNSFPIKMIGNLFFPLKNQRQWLLAIYERRDTDF
jgi:ubiquinone/menaquinone biosynthesis C-methylase UbiE